MLLKDLHAQARIGLCYNPPEINLCSPDFVPGFETNTEKSTETDAQTRFFKIFLSFLVFFLKIQLWKPHILNYSLFTKWERISLGLCPKAVAQQLPDTLHRPCIIPLTLLHLSGLSPGLLSDHLCEWICVYGLLPLWLWVNLLAQCPTAPVNLGQSEHLYTTLLHTHPTDPVTLIWALSKTLNVQQPVLKTPDR